MQARTQYSTAELNVEVVKSLVTPPVSEHIMTKNSSKVECVMNLKHV